MGYFLNLDSKDRAYNAAFTPPKTKPNKPIDNPDKLNANGQHPNLFISGDNLEGMKHLVKTHQGKIHGIYLDPPYNTGRTDMTYNDSFKREGKNIGISQWLAFLAPRLILAKELLSDNGAIFASINDTHMAHLKILMDDIFSHDNYLGPFIWRKKGGNSGAKHLGVIHEYVLVYAKDKRKLNDFRDTFTLPNKKRFNNEDAKGRYYLGKLCSASLEFNENATFPIYDKDGRAYYPVDVNEKRASWRWGKKKVERDYNELVFKNGRVYRKIYHKNYKRAQSLITDTVYGCSQQASATIEGLFGFKAFDYTKPVNLMKYIISLLCIKDTPNKPNKENKENILFLDMFAGSSTTAHAAMEFNAENIRNESIPYVSYIMLQSKELVDKDTKPYEKGFRTIDEIGIKRIELAAKQIYGDTGAEIDYHFTQIDLEPI